jgi:hypothetical protein
VSATPLPEDWERKGEIPHYLIPEQLKKRGIYISEY